MSFHRNKVQSRSFYIAVMTKPRVAKLIELHYFHSPRSRLVIKLFKMCCQSRRPVHDICDLIGFHSRTLHQFKNALTLSYKSLFHFIFLLCYKFPPFTLPRRDQTLAETELKQTRAGQKRKIIPLRNRNMCFQNQSHL